MIDRTEATAIAPSVSEGLRRVAATCLDEPSLVEQLKEAAETIDALACATARAPLTRRQVQLLNWIREYRELNSFSPSFEEIAEAFGYASLATVHEHIENLKKKGYVRTVWNAPRSIELI